MRLQRRLSRENCGCNGFHDQAAATEMREKRLKQHHTEEAGLETQHRKDNSEDLIGLLQQMDIRIPFRQLDGQYRNRGVGREAYCVLWRF
ncbi:hypothetical protein T4B_6348 [Trichinella pseudospiralis]|uniref:Uncharacterized protein n=1 Tax=Trichinella pseudospiralis TaxID=6337 RepID=A0A0V1HBL4_TRIPS|nr:hypothetical protein T4B_6348 [Trichinella pseudospiralis]KRZ41594.1 hypothetical protein T4C_12613 [Trichinella pseudospiralis]